MQRTMRKLFKLCDQGSTTVTTLGYLFLHFRAAKRRFIIILHRALYIKDRPQKLLETSGWKTKRSILVLWKPDHRINQPNQIDPKKTSISRNLSTSVGWLQTSKVYHVILIAVWIVSCLWNSTSGPTAPECYHLLHRNLYSIATAL